MYLTSRRSVYIVTRPRDYLGVRIVGQAYKCTLTADLCEWGQNPSAPPKGQCA